jgi:hypothetical protein
MRDDACGEGIEKDGPVGKGDECRRYLGGSDRRYNRECEINFFSLLGPDMIFS